MRIYIFLGFFIIESNGKKIKKQVDLFESVMDHPCKLFDEVIFAESPMKKVYKQKEKKTDKKALGNGVLLMKQNGKLYSPEVIDRSHRWNLKETGIDIINRSPYFTYEFDTNSSS